MVLATLVVWVAVRMPLSHYASIWRSFYKKIDGARYARGLGLRLSGRFCVLHLNIAVFTKREEKTKTNNSRVRAEPARSYSLLIIN